MYYKVKLLSTSSLRDCKGNAIPADMRATRVKTSYGVEQVSLGDKAGRHALLTRLDADRWVVVLFDGERKVEKYDNLARGHALHEALSWIWHGL